MQSDNRICILGLGLIGGSMALALKQSDPVERFWVLRSPENMVYKP